MSKEQRRDDIKNRHTLAIAERDAFTTKGSDNYKTLSEIANKIASEYENGEHQRHGFRFTGTTYSEVILSEHDKI